MSRLNELQERFRKFQEEQQQAQNAEQSEPKDKDAIITELENQLKDEKIKALQNEISDLKSPKPTKKKEIQSTEDRITGILSLVGFVFVLIYFLFPSDKSPKYVKSAASDLEAGLSLHLDVLMYCSNLQSNDSWFIGCQFKSGGRPVYLFEVKENSGKNPSYFDYELYAVNGKASQIMNKPKMLVYRINKSTTIHPVADLVSHFVNL